MLRLLHIENIAIIERVDIDFSTGFTVLTGETGAGKSIIIDAIGAIMGQRTSRDLIRNGAKKGCVSAVFDSLSPLMAEKLTEMGIECEEDGTLHVQRELSMDGKSVCRINMRPVTATVLRQISPYLINIHGQHDGQKLMQDEYHIDFLDSYCRAEKFLINYQPLYHKLFGLRREIRALERSERDRAQRLDMLQFQIEEISAAALQPDEEEALEEKKAFFDNVEKLSSALQTSNHALSGTDDFSGICSELDRISDSLSGIADVSSEFANLYRRAEELRYLAEDLAQSVASAASRTDYSAAERDLVEARLDEIYRLKRKYGTTIPEILAYYEQCVAELETLESSDERKEQLTEEYHSTLKIAREMASQLSAHRRSAAQELERLIIEQLADLDMTKVRLNISVTPQSKLNERGMDEVQFLIAANPGEPLKPLSRIASGGELSRIMLAIKNILTRTEDVGTLIFDEIDTGVSGRAAQKIAKKLIEISRYKQTLCVTHLPQLAAAGDQHLLIRKSVEGERTYTEVLPVEQAAREHELARMFSGDSVTESSLSNARELITFANEYKKELYSNVNCI